MPFCDLHQVIFHEKLPGVGHKTASVVISQAFNIPAFPVDTHIIDVLKDGVYPMAGLFNKPKEI